MNKFNVKYILIVISINFIFSAYLKNIAISLNQPDGTLINCFTSGDEFYHYLHDENDFTIIQNKEDGYYYYAVRWNDSIIPSDYLVNEVNPNSVGIEKNILISKNQYLEKRSIFNNRIALRGNAPSVGTVNNINIFIRFDDEVEFSNSRLYYDDKFSNPDGPSMYHYYKEVSYDLLTVNTVHYPDCDSNTNLSYKDEFPRCYYAPCADNSDNCCGYLNEDEGWERGNVLLKNAIEYIADEVPEDLVIDSNDDGLIDNITFLVKGQPGAWADFLWPHRSTVWYPTYINGKRAAAYNLNLADSPDYFTVGVLCHEFFHSIGAPDLYHYWDDVSPVAVGGWDVMDASSNIPQSMSAYMKYKYTDWIEHLSIIQDSGIYELKPLSSSIDNIFRINSPLNNNEYFILEYRKKEGIYEINTPGSDSGLIIYRVINGLNGNADGPPDELYVYREGGTLQSSGSFGGAVFNADIGRVEFNDNTNPSCFLSDGTEGGINLSNVGSPGETIQFEIMNLTLIPEFDQVIYDSDNDGNINPGEEIILDLLITNLSNIDANDIVASISVLNDNIQIENSEINFGMINAGGYLNQSITLNIGPEVLGVVNANLSLVGSFIENSQLINYNKEYELNFEVTLNQIGFPYITSNEIRTSPIVSDLNLDNQYEIIFGDHFGDVHALNAQGEQIFENIFPFNTGGQIWGSPAIADIDNDGYDDIIVCSKNKHLYIIDKDGLKLDYDAGTQLIGTPSIGNFDLDDELEIAIAGYSNNENNFLVINPNGSDVFNLNINEKNKSGFAVADFNNNNIDDIVFGTDSDKLYLVYDDGTIADGFPFEADDKFRKSPLVINYFNENIIIAVSENQHLYAIDNNGLILFEILFDNEITTSPSILNIENNVNICIGLDNGDIKCIDMQGNIVEEYSFNVVDGIVGEITFSDLNSNGLIELFASTETGGLYIFEIGGQLHENFPIINEFPLSSALTIYDIDNDNDLEVFVGSTNSLLAIDIKSIGSSEGYWNIFKGNNKRSSYFKLECIPMDVNNDGIINVLDIISIVNFIFLNDSVNECAADINQDGIINVVDIVAIVNEILDE